MLRTLRLSLLCLLLLTILLSPCTSAAASELFFSGYVTVSSVIKIAQEESAQAEALEVIQRLNLKKVYLEVYRSGVEAEEGVLEACRDFFLKAGLAVCGGIATTPGGDFGVPANEGLTWMNYQNPKTQADLERVMRRAARVFDEFIVDDFLCSGDKSAESDAARRGRSWGDYRRDLLTQLSSTVFIEPAREERPDITMIIKYPQWYDRFHLFGYDVERGPQLYDRVFVGTESRGSYTQRFGFVQPYEGFINYRWLSAIAGEKRGGAWFDHGDCEGIDFVDQAWQSVLAGAPELVLFNYRNLATPHEGHELLMQDEAQLKQLAQTVREHPVTGVAAYKPMHSDAGGDLYVMDFIGMLGVPLTPTPHFPAEASSIFLPTQAAADPEVVEKTITAIQAGKRVVMTTGFLAKLPDAQELYRLVGVRGPLQSKRLIAKNIIAEGHRFSVPFGLELETDVEVGSATTVLEAVVGRKKIPYLLKRQSSNGGFVAVLNCHTFSQADFDAVGEVLLAPKPIFLLDAPLHWVNAIRSVFGPAEGVMMHGPGRVTLQPLAGAGWFIQNYRKEAVSLDIEFATKPERVLDQLTKKTTDLKNGRLSLEMPARSRQWLVPVAPTSD